MGAMPVAAGGREGGREGGEEEGLFPSHLEVYHPFFSPPGSEFYFPQPVGKGTEAAGEGGDEGRGEEQEEEGLDLSGPVLRSLL